MTTQPPIATTAPGQRRLTLFGSRPTVVIDPAHYRAARDACRSGAPDLFFASYFMPKHTRHAVFSLVAVYLQLADILKPQAPLSNDPPPDDTCSSETPQQKREVCAAILEHLYQGKPTGKPELDSFYQIVSSYNLPRQHFESLADGIMQEATIPRYATWTRLRKQLDQTAGTAALIASGVPRTQGANPALNKTAIHQARAWAVGMRMVSILRQVDDDWQHGRLMLPQEDLNRFGLSENDIARFHDRHTTAHDPRWTQLMKFQIGRVKSLLRGGSRCLHTAYSHKTPRAAAVLSAMYWGLLDDFERRGADPFAPLPEATMWDRLRYLPKALRLVAIAPRNEPRP